MPAPINRPWYSTNRVSEKPGAIQTVSGLYLAGQIAGIIAGIASRSCGKADASVVTIGANARPVLASLSVAPSSTALFPSGSQQFQAAAAWNDGIHVLPSLAWSALVGTVDASGLYTATASSGLGQVMASVIDGSLADAADVVIAASAPSPPSGQDPVPTGTVILDTRKGGPQSIQNATTMAEALSAIQSSPFVRLAENNWMNFTIDLDGNGTRAFRAEWKDWRGKPGGQGRRVRIYFAKPPKQIYIQWKHWMGRTPTGGGIGGIGAFDVTNQFDPNGNAGRKYLLMPRAVPGLGNRGRADVVWAGPAPVKVQWNFVNLPHRRGNKSLNRSPFDPEAHYNKVITFTMYFQAESSPGASDGILRIWYNGVLRGEWLNQPVGDTAIDRFNMSDTFQSPIQDQTEYFWDLVAWMP